MTLKIELTEPIKKETKIFLHTGDQFDFFVKDVEVYYRGGVKIRIEFESVYFLFRSNSNRSNYVFNKNRRHLHGDITYKFPDDLCLLVDYHDISSFDVNYLLNNAFNMTSKKLSLEEFFLEWL